MRERLDELDVSSRERLAEAPQCESNESEIATLLTLSHEASRLNATTLPSRSDYIMPSRLGNVLRLYESEAGRQYGLDIAVIAPHLSLVADKDHVDYLNDQRTLLDLSVRLCITGLSATLLAIVLLWPYGAQLLVALVPYSFAYVAYRGSVIVASDYASAVAVIMDLNRFALYDRLNVAQPMDTDDERRKNSVLMALLSRDARASLEYVAAIDTATHSADRASISSRLRRFLK